MLESSISIPISADSAAAVASSWRQLRSLKLCLGRGDVSEEGLQQLGAFTQLKR